MVLPSPRHKSSTGRRYGLAFLIYVALRRQRIALSVVYGLFRRMALPDTESPLAARSHSSHTLRAAFEQYLSASAQIQWRATDCLHEHHSDGRCFAADGNSNLQACAIRLADFAVGRIRMGAFHSFLADDGVRPVFPGPSRTGH